MSATPPLDATARAALRAKAEKASPGPWFAWRTEKAGMTVQRAVGWIAVMSARGTDADAEFIAACSPDVILALLAAVERGSSAAPRSNGTTIGHEPGVLPQGMTFHAGELGDAYVAGAKSGRDHQPTDETIARSADAYVKLIHVRRMAEAAARATPTGADDAE